MSAHRPLHARPWAAVASVATLALTLSACGNGGGSNDGDGNAAGGSLTIGTTDKITSLDPAGSYDNGSFAVMNQIYPFLLNTPLGSPDVEPDIAASAEFTSPTEYTVTLKPGLKWANGHDLTSSDVKFTFDRQVAIADDNGPSSLLWNLDSVDAPDDTTVVFHLKSGNDQTFPQVLSSPVGPIVDEEVFDADAVTPDQTIVDGKAFAGQYTITSYTMNELVSYAAYDGYQGLLGAPKTAEINVKYFADASNLKLEIEQGGVDVAYRSLSATDIESLEGNDDVEVVNGPGGEIRYIVFNFDTMPYGAKTPEADAAKRSPCGRPPRTSSTATSSPTRSTRHLHPAVLVRSGRPDRRHGVPQGPVRRRQGRPRRREGREDPVGRGSRDAGGAEPAVLERPLRPVLG